MATENGGSGGPPVILLLCTHFRRGENDHFYTNELAHALAAAGACVRVGVVDWYAPPGGKADLVVMPDGVEVLHMPPRAIRGFGRYIADASKWLGASWFLMRDMKRRFANRRTDMVVAWAPLVAMGFPIFWATRHFRCPSLAYIADFFPFPQYANKQFGRVTMWAGFVPEAFLMRRFDTVACMSQAGVDYLRDHYPLKAGQETPVLRLWSDISRVGRDDRSAVRRRHDLPDDRPIVLFGGQIIEGRGIEDVLVMARQAAFERPDILFLILGGGRLEPLVMDYIALDYGNLLLRAPVPRDEYLKIASACDIGLVSTVATAGVPTFPSKTIDYMRAGLPVVASVETVTDYRTFIEHNGFGVAVNAGDPIACFAAVRDIVDDPITYARMRQAGYAALGQFDVAVAAAAILKRARVTG
jgi:glycosyltransferase involved in cell wall biosynthesis